MKVIEKIGWSFAVSLPGLQDAVLGTAVPEQLVESFNKGLEDQIGDVIVTREGDVAKLSFGKAFAYMSATDYLAAISPQ